MKTLIVGKAPEVLEKLVSALGTTPEDLFFYQGGSAFDPAAGYELILVFEPAIWLQEHRKAVGILLSGEASKQVFIYGDEPELRQQVASALQALGLTVQDFGSWQEGAKIQGGAQAWQQWKSQSKHERK